MSSLLHKLGALRAVPKAAVLASAPAPPVVPWSALAASPLAASRVIRFTNCVLFAADGTFRREDLWVRDGRIIDPVRRARGSSAAAAAAVA